MNFLYATNYILPWLTKKLSYHWNEKVAPEEYSEPIEQDEKVEYTHAPLSLNIVIVGGGVGGLATAYLLGRAGHKVTVLEGATQLSQVGAGIQITPNMSRLLLRWGVEEQLRKVAVVPQMLSIRRYATGELIGWRGWGDSIDKDHGSPYFHVHRADLHQVILDLAKPYMTLRLNSKVTSVNPSAPSVTLASGEIIHADVIIGADGVHSQVRETVFGIGDRPLPTGDAAYRATLPTSEMMKDPDLKQLVDEASTNAWLGPNRHVVGYCIRNKEEYNLVLIHPCKDHNETVRNVDPETMRDDFVGFEPRVQKLLALVPSPMVWSLIDRAPLESWVHQDGKVCLLGDACHPMLPYRAQGSAMAIEDAAVLGNLFSRISSRAQIPELLRGYQKIRHPRTTESQIASRMNQKIFHFEDGPAQEARDQSMRLAMEAAIKEARGESTDGCPGSQNLWADKARNDALFNYDADDAADKWWTEYSLSQTLLQPAGEHVVEVTPGIFEFGAQRQSAMVR